MIDTHGRKYVQPAFDKFAKVLIKLKLNPIKITFLALIIGLFAIAALFLGKLWLAAILLWISGIFDVLDGTVARATDSSSDLGAFLDITFDRLVEIGIIIGLVYIEPQLGIMLVVLTSAIVMSMTVFLTVSSLAKNDGKKSLYYQTGIAERTEGFIFFTLLILWVEMRMVIGYVFAAVVFITALQRFLEAVKMLRKG